MICSFKLEAKTTLIIASIVLIPPRSLVLHSLVPRSLVLHFLVPHSLVPRSLVPRSLVLQSQLVFHWWWEYYFH